MTKRTTDGAVVEMAAVKVLNAMGFAPVTVAWAGKKTFEATFRRDADAAACARELQAMGRTAVSMLARFDDDAFVSFTL